MFPSRHFLACTLLFIVMFPVYKFWALLVFVSGWLIDSDHYLWTFFRFGWVNPMRSYRFYAEKRERMMYRDVLHIFHTLEFLVVVGVIFAIFWKYDFLVFPLALSLVVHMIMDFLFELSFLLRKKEIDTGILRVFSFYEWVRKRREKNKLLKL